jgi:hypothetical protein
MPLFGRKKATSISDQHALITHLPLAGKDFGISNPLEKVFELEDQLMKAAASIGGEHDGNLIGEDEVILYTYGPDADVLFDVVTACLQVYEIPGGSFAIKRYGRADDDSAREERVPLP